MEIKVSIIICTYNRANYIAKALDSILMQTYQNYEVLVVDDASSDNTEEVVKKYLPQDARIKYFKNSNNLGIARSRNKGVGLAQGEYIAMLDSDDYWLSADKLAKQIAVLELDKAVGLIGTGIICIDENDKEIKKDIFAVGDYDIRSRILAKNQFMQSSVVFRKEAYKLAGGYQEKFIVCEDLDLWLAIGNKYKFANLIEPMVAYRLHSGGISKSRKLEIAKTTDEIIDKYKKNYPHYLRAKFKSLLRIIFSYF
ncbi:MAG: glycosyltransferase [Patescibacteria group bacterium]